MNFKKSKIRSLVLLALAAVAFCGLIWFANKDRPVYRSSNMAGTDYESPAGCGRSQDGG